MMCMALCVGEYVICSLQQWCYGVLMAAKHFLFTAALGALRDNEGITSAYPPPTMLRIPTVVKRHTRVIISHVEVYLFLFI